MPRASATLTGVDPGLGQPGGREGPAERCRRTHGTRRLGSSARSRPARSAAPERHRARRCGRGPPRAGSTMAPALSSMLPRGVSSAPSRISSVVAIELVLEAGDRHVVGLDHVEDDASATSLCLRTARVVPTRRRRAVRAGPPARLAAPPARPRSRPSPRLPLWLHLLALEARDQAVCGPPRWRPPRIALRRGARCRMRRWRVRPRTCREAGRRRPTW